MDFQYQTGTPATWSHSYIPSGLGTNVDYDIIMREVYAILNNLSDLFNGIDLRLQIDPLYVGERLPFTDRDAIFPDTAAGRDSKEKADRRNDRIESIRRTAVSRISSLFGAKVVRQMYLGQDGMQVVSL